MNSGRHFDAVSGDRRIHRITAAAVFALALCPFSSGLMVDLTSQNFEEVAHSGKVVVVLFYAPWCGRCKRRMPDWSELAETVSQSEVTVARIDCTVEEEACTKYGVSAYPAIKYWATGSSLPGDYDGSPSVDGLQNFVNKQLGGGCGSAEKAQCSEKESEVLTAVCRLVRDHSGGPWTRMSNTPPPPLRVQVPR
ncbi:Protein disulfide-isomerase-like protein EhSep2 [Diplonema papillatum]|nr:Protein disulfide-isomerase-like protein EhSep2 [Diplonema papillatum]